MSVDSKDDCKQHTKVDGTLTLMNELLPHHSNHNTTTNDTNLSTKLEFNNNPSEQQQQQQQSQGNNNNSKRKRKRKNKNHNSNNANNNNNTNNNNNNNNNNNKPTTTNHNETTTSTIIITHEMIQNMDATEYLRYVTNQAKKLPDTVTAIGKNNYNKYNNPAPIITTTTTTTTTKSSSSSKYATKAKTNGEQYIIPTGCLGSIQYLLGSTNNNPQILYAPPTSNHIPVNNTKVWVNQIIHNFERLRTYIDQCKFDPKTTNQQHHQQRPHRRIPVPPLKDRIGWFLFCMGTTNNNSTTTTMHDDDDDDDDIVTTNETNDSKDVEQSQMERNSNNIANEIDSTSSSTDGIIMNDENDDDNEFDNTTKRTDNHNNKNIKNKDNATATPCDEKTIGNNTTEVWDETNIPEHGYYPSVTLLLQMDQVMIRRVLEHLTHYIVVHHHHNNNYDNPSSLSSRVHADTRKTIPSTNIEESTTTTTTVNNYPKKNWSTVNDNSFDCDKEQSTAVPNGTRSNTNTTNNNNLFLWIYSLLARLELPIHRDDCVTLYTLLKQLTYIRYKLRIQDDPSSNTSNDDKYECDRNNNNNGTLNPTKGTITNNNDNGEYYLAMINTLIVLIGIYFGQGGTYETLMQVAKCQ